MNSASSLSTGIAARAILERLFFAILLMAIATISGVTLLNGVSN